MLLAIFSTQCDTYRNNLYIYHNICYAQEEEAMGMRQCTGGHWYDDSKYTACPYCNNAASNLSGGMQREDSKTIALSDKEPKPDTGEEG